MSRGQQSCVVVSSSSCTSIYFKDISIVKALQCPRNKLKMKRGDTRPIERAQQDCPTEPTYLQPTGCYMLGWTSIELGFLFPTVYAEGPNSNRTGCQTRIHFQETRSGRRILACGIFLAWCGNCAGLFSKATALSKTVLAPNFFFVG